MIRGKLFPAFSTTVTTAVACLLMTGCPSSSPTVLTFDELPRPQPVDGLTVQGVTFGYQGGSFTEYHGLSGPIEAVFLDRPYLDGETAGILTLDFAVPTPILKFGVAFRKDPPPMPGLTVELFDADLTSFAVIPVDTASLIVFAEAQFVHEGTPVRRAVLDFDETETDFFHLDNLTFVPKH